MRRVFWLLAGGLAAVVPVALVFVGSVTGSNDSRVVGDQNRAGRAAEAGTTLSSPIPTYTSSLVSSPADARDYALATAVHDYSVAQEDITGVDTFTISRSAFLLEASSDGRLAILLRYVEERSTTDTFFVSLVHGRDRVFGLTRTPPGMEVKSSPVDTLVILAAKDEPVISVFAVQYSGTADLFERLAEVGSRDEL